MNLAQKVCLDDFRVKFETGSLWNQKLGHRAKSAENLLNTLAVTFAQAVIMNLAQNVCLDDF